MNSTSKLLAAAIVLTASANASALQAIDNWQLDPTAAGFSAKTINIGHLNLSGGVGSIVQEVGAVTKDPFVGASFTELGAVYTTSFTKENCSGFCDTGFPQNYAGNLNGMRLTFTGFAGTLTSVTPVGGGNFDVVYSFTPGVGNIAMEGTSDAGATYTTLANISLQNPSGGTLGNFYGGLQSNGTTSILGLIKTPVLYANLFRDSLGVSYDPLINAVPPELYVDIQTQNTLTNTGAPNPSAPFTPCTVGTSGWCRNLTVNSDGSMNLARAPEPESLSLMAIGLLGLAVASRRKHLAKSV